MTADDRGWVVNGHGTNPSVTHEDDLQPTKEVRKEDRSGGQRDGVKALSGGRRKAGGRRQVIAGG